MCVHDQWCVCGWRGLVALVVGCMALPSTCVPLCHSSQMALTTHMPTLCCTTPNGWRKDLVNCHHALVGCFVTTPFLFPFPTTIVSSSFSNHPFFSRPLLLACLEIIFGDVTLMASKNGSSSFFPFHWLTIWVFQFCEVSMERFYFFLIVCMMSFDVLCICHDVLYHCYDERMLCYTFAWPE